LDVEVGDVHDFSTGNETIGYEDLGFAEWFGGRKLVETDATMIGGSLPVHTSGGPPGATGVARCEQLFVALHGEAINQVGAARIVLAHNIGGPTAASAVTIVEGPGHGGW
jgi:acetyl-CoA C-acetyltransferase